MFACQRVVSGRLGAGQQGQRIKGYQRLTHVRTMRVSNNVNRLREAYEYTMSEWTGHAQTEQHIHTHTHTPVHARGCVCVCGDMLNFAARCTSCCCRRCLSSFCCYCCGIKGFKIVNNCTTLKTQYVTADVTLHYVTLRVMAMPANSTRIRNRTKMRIDFLYVHTYNTICGTY